MQSSQAQSPFQRWLIDALILGLGGATLSFLVLALANLILGSTSRVSSGGTPALLLVFLLVFGSPAFLLLKRRFGSGLSCGLMLAWIGLYYVVTFISALFFKQEGMPLWAYLAIWLIIGALFALFARSRPRTLVGVAAATGVAAAATISKARPSNAPLKSSGFGRIPPETVILLSQHVSTATTAAAKLPQNAPASIRHLATGIITTYLLRDWWDNGNRAGLDQPDVQDVQSFVKYAWWCAAPAEHLAHAEAIFASVLDALMSDWCETWGDEGPGAPAWQKG